MFFIHDMEGERRKIGADEPSELACPRKPELKVFWSFNLSAGTLDIDRQASIYQFDSITIRNSMQLVGHLRP